ncbi:MULTISPECIES: hypothetical protein [Bradyrhizobium]|uniref:hypothetical protein n=1 Tax=Bradyrhizobium TaxID=374 RepID=UPI002010EEA2|nr:MULTISPECIES: hypothetical protein [Bradyrhizobium]
MLFITAPKPGPLNWLEGFALTSILQGFPIFAAASLMVKLLGVYRGSSPVLTIALASIFYGIFVVSVGSAFPKVKSGYEAQFFDASLSPSEKIARWRAKPATSLQLMASVAAVAAGDDRGVRCGRCSAALPLLPPAPSPRHAARRLRRRPELRARLP